MKKKKQALAIIFLVSILTFGFSWASADELQMARQQEYKTIIYVPYDAEEEPTAKQHTYKNDTDELINVYCSQYGVDDVLAIAIARVETGHYKSEICRNLNNYGGMSDGQRYYRYPTKEQGIEAFVKMLKAYKEDGLTEPKEMVKRYCPNSKSWANLVEKVMKEVERND